MLNFLLKSQTDNTVLGEIFGESRQAARRIARETLNVSQLFPLPALRRLFYHQSFCHHSTLHNPCRLFVSLFGPISLVRAATLMRPPVLIIGLALK